MSKIRKHVRRNNTRKNKHKKQYRFYTFGHLKMGQNPIKNRFKVRSFHTCAKFDYKHSLK